MRVPWLRGVDIHLYWRHLPELTLANVTQLIKPTQYVTTPRSKDIYVFPSLIKHVWKNLLSDIPLSDTFQRQSRVWRTDIRLEQASNTNVF